MLPASGSRNSDGSLSPAGEKAAYWSSTLLLEAYANFMFFDAEQVTLLSGGDLSNALPVRCVTNQTPPQISVSKYIKHKVPLGGYVAK